MQEGADSFAWWDRLKKLKDKIRFFQGLRELVDQFDDASIVERECMFEVDLRTILANAEEAPPLPETAERVGDTDEQVEDDIDLVTGGDDAAFLKEEDEVCVRRVKSEEG
jgi:hypothetical protein